MLEIDLESVGDLGRRVFVEMLESECVGKKEIVLNNFFIWAERTRRLHTGYRYEYLARCELH